MYPQLLKIGPVSINSYGFMIAMGFLTCGFLLQQELQRVNLNKKFAWQIIIAALIGGFLGSKIYFILKHPHLIHQDLWNNLFSASGQIWHGGLLGGFLAVAALTLKNKYNCWQIADLIGPLALLGQAFGRIGCFLAGDGCYGPPSEVPWAMKFPNGVVSTLNNPQLQELYVQMHPEFPVPADIAVHPTPLYHFILLMLFFVFLWMIRKKKFRTGTLWGLYLILIGFERLITEIWRLDSKYIMGTFSEAQFISISLIIIGSSGLIYLYKFVNAKTLLST